MTRISTIDVEISEEIAHTGIGEATLAATLFVPDSVPSSTAQLTVFCLPGGSYSKAYYDFHAPGETEEAYSFARYLAKHGILVVTIDHLGLGESSRVADGHKLTAEVLSLANHTAMQRIREGLTKGTLLPDVPPMQILSLGLGHSMGAFLSIVQQATFQTHAGLILLGWSNYALQADDFIRRWAQARNLQLGEDLSQYDVLTQMYQFGEDGYVQVYRPASHGLFYAPDVPPQLIEKDTTLATDVPAPILRQIADLSTLQARAQHIHVPIVLGFGGLIDVSADPEKEPATYGSQEVTLYTLLGSAHCHNFASTRLLLWEWIVNWIEELAHAEAFTLSPHASSGTGIRAVS